jgi:hypothetical protein
MHCCLVIQVVANVGGDYPPKDEQGTQPSGAIIFPSTKDMRQNDEFVMRWRQIARLSASRHIISSWKVL